VVTNVPGCDEVVRDGWNGRLVKPRTPHELAAAIVALLSDRGAARAMGARAAQTVRAQFGLAMTAARYRDLYLSYLTSPPRCHSACGPARGN
jgi:glycosyltransferase involved in cell wall biosynthesis